MPSEQTGVGVEGQIEMDYRQISETKKRIHWREIELENLCKIPFKVFLFCECWLCKEDNDKKRKRNTKASSEDNICLIYWRLN